LKVLVWPPVQRGDTENFLPLIVRDLSYVALEVERHYAQVALVIKKLKIKIKKNKPNLSQTNVVDPHDEIRA